MKRLLDKIISFFRDIRRLNELRDCEKKYGEVYARLDEERVARERLSRENAQLAKMQRVFIAAWQRMGPLVLYHNDLRGLYWSIHEAFDPGGVLMLRAAESILGKFEPAHFAYEDNLGWFDCEGGARNAYKALLVDNADRLGQPFAHRWEMAANGYEKCIDFTIDTNTLEYKEFEMDLYHAIFAEWTALLRQNRRGSDAPNQ